MQVWWLPSMGGSQSLHVTGLRSSSSYSNQNTICSRTSSRSSLSSYPSPYSPSTPSTPSLSPRRTPAVFRFRLTIDMSVRCRFALFLCVFIILVNILFKVQTDFVETLIYKQRRIVIYEPAAVGQRPQPLPNALKGEERVGEGLVLGGRGEDGGIVVDTERRRLGLGNRQDIVNSSPDLPNDLPPLERDSLCRSGHLPGLNTICDDTGCLPLLLPPFPDLPSSPRPPLAPPELIRRLDYIPGGWIDPVHYTLVALVTGMQWDEGVYGSVGEMEAGVGKMTSLLTYNVDVDVGERLFVCDDFIRSSRDSLDDGQYETFVQQIGKTEFKVTDMLMTSQMSDAESRLKRIYVYKGSKLDLTKQLFIDSNIPQFRFLTMDTSLDDSATAMTGLVTAACLLRDGGILVMDGVDSMASRDHVLGVLTHYFVTVHGASVVLTPLLSARNKLYLTTTGWKYRYSEYLLRHSMDRLRVMLTETTTTLLGRPFSYLSYT